MTHACKYCRGTGISELPSKMPKWIREWLQFNDDVPPYMMICPEHGLWYEGVDPLAPYHWETSYCLRCPR